MIEPLDMEIITHKVFEGIKKPNSFNLAEIKYDNDDYELKRFTAYSSNGLLCFHEEINHKLVLENQGRFNEQLFGFTDKLLKSQLCKWKLRIININEKNY